MKKRITSTVKRGFRVHLFLMTIMLTLSFSGMAQNRINSAKNQKSLDVKVESTSKKEKDLNRSKVDYSALDFKKGEIFGAFNPNQELVDKRDQFGKHFQNQDGTTSAILTAGGSLHFLDNGKWKAIDRQITANNTNRHSQHGYVNEKNSFLSFYPNYASAGIITEYREGNVVEGINKKMIWLDENYNPINQANINSSVAQISENKITYSNVFSGIDLVYYQQNDGRKMDYVINNSNALANIPSQAKYLAFAEDFSLPKGAKIDEDKNEEGNVIALNVSVNGTIVFRYDMPKHSDSNNKEITSYYKIVQNTIYTVVSKEWLNSGLTFPIFIDPTVTVYPTAAGNYNTGAIDANALKTANNDMYIGMRFAYGATSGSRRFMRAWSSFNVTSIPAGSTISNVIFGCYIGLNSFDAAYGEMARVVPITSGIPNTATGATLYNMCGENVPSALFSIGAGGTGNQSLNITSVVTTFVSNSLASGIFSLGFAPVGSFDTGYTEQVGIYGSTRTQSTSTGKPYLTITYESSTPCSGTPTGGTTVLNNPLGATSSIIAASVSGDTTGVSGLSYQWESATSASGPWTNISGATLATANITASNTTTTIYYRRKITCSGSSSYSTAVSYSTTCRPSYTEGNCAGPGDCRYIIISNVTLGSINNTTSTGSPAQGIAAPAYNNYSGTQSTSLNDTTTYTLTAKYTDNGSPVNQGKIGLWIDWSGDGTFSGPNDFIGSSAALNNNGTATFTINVPAGATAGVRTLRVRSIFAEDVFLASDACSQLDYGETEDYAVNVTVSPLVCSTVSDLAAVIGTPANGTNHVLNVSWTGLTGATSYDVEFSMDGSTYNNVGTGNTTSTSAILNAADMPNAPFWFRVRAKNASETCDWTLLGPVYTAADLPNLVTLANPTGTTMQISLQAETPVENPAITTYSLFNETLGLYVQADGSLGATEVFQTKATWGTKTVTGLTAETEYCFYAKAKNEDGDVRFTAITTLAPTQEFNSGSVITTGSTGNSTNWFAPNSNPPFVHSTGGCNGGRVGYANTTTTTWSNFLRSPVYNLTGMTEVTLGFTMSNSYNAANTTDNSFYINYYDTTYRSTNVTSIKIDGVPYTATGTTGGKINFDVVRNCVYVEMTFNISSSTNLSQIYFYYNANKANLSGYSFYIDDFAIANGASFSSPDKVCLTTTAGCTAEITNVTGNTGCGSVTLLAAGATGTTAYNWYDAAIGGTLLQSSASDSYTTPVLTETITYYVSASNATCESPRVAVIATYAPTTAEIASSTGASSCIPGTLTIYAETNNDANYTVNWYANETGGTAIHTGYSYTPNPIILETTSFWAAAVDGDCESERTEVAITLSSKTWNGSVDTNWNVAGNWSPAGIPNINNCVVIANTTNAPILLTGNAGYAKSLSLLEGSSLVVQSTSSLTVTEKVTIAEDVNGATVATMTLMNNGYLLQTQNAQANINQGKIKVHRNSTPMFRLDASAWSSPVENQKLYDFALGTVFGRVYSYDEGTNAFVNTGITTNSTFVNGLGYSVRSPNTYPTYNASNPPAPVVFEGEFYGKPNNGNIGISITANNLGNNYVGNPYPSPIDAMGLLDNNNSIDALYFWTHEAHAIGGTYAANNYASFNLSGGTVSAAGGEEPDGIIQVGQGFVVKATQNISLEFTNDIRINYSDGQFFRTNNNVVERHRMWLNLSSSTTEFNQALIGYIPNATMEKDHQIDAKMLDYAGSAIYSLIDTESYVIQGRSLPFDIADEVPLGIKAQQAGIFTIAIDHVDGLFQDGQTIYIVDQMTNLVHNLSAGAFTFVSEQGTFNSRFKIVYQDNLLGVSNPEITNNDWIVYKNDDKIHVQTNGFEIDNISIYDLTGRLLLQDDNVNSATFSCNANFAEQVLLVRVNKTLVKKVL